MRKELYLIIFLGIIILVLAGALLFPFHTSKKEAGDITVTAPAAGAIVSSPLKVSGTVNGNGWTGFEGQVGTVTLLDSKGKEVSVGILLATTDWTQLPTTFETNLEFSSVSAGSGSLVFHNENPSGDPAKDKTFVVPVIFK